MIGLPVSAAIEPTTSCNLRCPECPSGLRKFSRPTGMLDFSFFRNFIDQSSNHLCYLIFYFQGEPYLNPQFTDMVKYASQKKIYTAVSTNGHFFTDENSRKTIQSGLDRLIISIDGTTQDVYENYRVGGHLKKVIDGTTNVLNWRKKLKSKKPLVVFQFLVVRPNEHQVEEIKKLAKQIGVDDVWFKTAQIYNYENGHPLIPQNEKFSRYKKVANNKWLIKNRLMNHCWKLWHSCVVTWNGTVVPCCFDKDAIHPLGNLNNNSLSEIWYNSEYNRFRKSLLKARSEIDICSNCTEGTKIWG